MLFIVATVPGLDLGDIITEVKQQCAAISLSGGIQIEYATLGHPQKLVRISKKGHAQLILVLPEEGEYGRSYSYWGLLQSAVEDGLLSAHQRIIRMGHLAAMLDLIERRRVNPLGVVDYSEPATVANGVLERINWVYQLPSKPYELVHA